MSKAMGKKAVSSTSQCDGFLNALVDQYLTGMDREGLRSKLADVLVRDVAVQVTVERLAAEIQSRKGEELVDQLTKAAVDKLLDE